MNDETKLKLLEMSIEMSHVVIANMKDKNNKYSYIIEEAQALNDDMPPENYIDVIPAIYNRLADTIEPPMRKPILEQK